MAAGSDIQDEWEYEYSNTETETFLVDLDLSSVNGVIRSKNAGDRKSLRSGALSTKSAAQNARNQNRADDVDDAENPGEDEDNEEGAEDERENDENQDGNSPPQQTDVPIEPSLLDDDVTGRIQILDLDTTNPIISYNGSIYSCTWHDMLGTSMFISKHQEAPFHEPEISTDDYDLIGISRVKVVGQRAKVVPKAASKKRRKDDEEESTETPLPKRTLQQPIYDGRSLGTIMRTNPKQNIEIKQQANFLERLMELKKAKGELDTVRTFVDRRTMAAEARQAHRARQAKEEGREKEETADQRLRREITELNRRVVKGDNNAIERLKEIYAEIEDVEDEEDEVLVESINNLASADVTGSAGAVSNATPSAAGASTGQPHVPGS